MDEILDTCQPGERSQKLRTADSVVQPPIGGTKGADVFQRGLATWPPIVSHRISLLEGGECFCEKRREVGFQEVVDHHVTIGSCIQEL